MAAEGQKGGKEQVGYLRLDIKGNFQLNTYSPVPIPKGWNFNKSGYWNEKTDRSEMIERPDKGDRSLKLTSQGKPIHLYSIPAIPTAEGQAYIVKAKVKGIGSGAVGVYWMPYASPRVTKFDASVEWTEIIAEVRCPALIKGEPVKSLSALLVVDPQSSIEFSEVSLEVVPQ